MIVWIALAVALVGGAVGAALYWIDQQDIEGDTDTDTEGEGEGGDADTETEAETNWLADAQQYIERARALAARAWAHTPDDMAARSLDAAAGSETKRARWRMAGAVAIVLGAVAGMAVAAASLNGTVAAVAFVGAAVLGAAGPPVAIMTLREGMPLGGLVGQGLAIAAQIAFGRAALVRRDDGRYEWTVLRERADGFVAELADGRDVPIAADDGELYAFGFGRLAVVEQKTDRNLSRWTVPEGSTDGGTETRAGIEVAPPQREAGGILVSLATIQRAVRGSASSTLVRRGRDKALDEEGGEQGVSQLWTMAFATILLIVGFGMTFVALSL